MTENTLIPLSRCVWPGDPRNFEPSTVPANYEYQHLVLVSHEKQEPLWDYNEQRKIIRPTIHITSDGREGFQFRKDLSRRVASFPGHPIIQTQSGFWSIAHPSEEILSWWNEL